jgi:L-lactate permease
METVQLPVDLLHWLLVPLRWRASETGPIAMFTAAIVAVLAFRTPWKALDRSLADPRVLAVDSPEAVKMQAVA